MWWAVSQTSSLDPTQVLSKYGLAGLAIFVLGTVCGALFRYLYQAMQASLQRERSRADTAEARVVALSDQAVATATKTTEAVSVMSGVGEQMRDSASLLREYRAALERAVLILDRRER